MLLIDTILGSIMFYTVQNSILYDILFALITGATASFIVSIVIELSNNYKNNKLAWHELMEYYFVVADYELMKKVLMRDTVDQREEQEMVEEPADREGILQDGIEHSADLIQATWKQLPKVMPVLKQTLEDKKQFLTDDEILALRSIVSSYQEIRTEIFHRLMSPLLYNALNHPDEAYLKGIYPQNILDDMPEWMKLHLRHFMTNLINRWKKEIFPLYPGISAIAV